jgi:hypothetical protein
MAPGLEYVAIPTFPHLNNPLPMLEAVGVMRALTRAPPDKITAGVFVVFSLAFQIRLGSE